METQTAPILRAILPTCIFDLTAREDVDFVKRGTLSRRQYDVQIGRTSTTVAIIWINFFLGEYDVTVIPEPLGIKSAVLLDQWLCEHREEVIQYLRFLASQN